MFASVYENEAGAAAAPIQGGSSYQRRQPENTVLYQMIADEFSTFREEVFELGGGHELPGFVLQEFERYLDCGILARGFARVRCATCRKEILVGFSCKGRGICPSCGARRMHDIAAHLVDRILPSAPYRQWVLSFPKWLRVHIARDPCLAKQVQNIFQASIFVWQRKKAREKGVEGELGVGSVVFSQRFGDSLNLNFHFHAIVPDGIFIKQGNDAMFCRLPFPKDTDIEWITIRILRKIRRLLEKREFQEQRDMDHSSKGYGHAMDMLTQLALQHAGSENHQVPYKVSRSKLSVFIEGFSLHAGTHVHQNDRPGLEHLCRYGSRPAIAIYRLTKLEDGKYQYSLKYPLRNGSYKLILTGQELMRRLALLVPRPRIHLIRYFGVFASRSHWRALIVPSNKNQPSGCGKREPVSSSYPESVSHVPDLKLNANLSFNNHHTFNDCFPVMPAEAPRQRHLDWASLLKRVYGDELLICPHCGNKRSIIAFIEDPAVARKILDHLGLDSTGPPRSKSRVPTQTCLF